MDSKFDGVNGEKNSTAGDWSVDDLDAVEIRRSN